MSNKTISVLGFGLHLVGTNYVTLIVEISSL